MCHKNKALSISYMKYILVDIIIDSVYLQIEHPLIFLNVYRYFQP